MSVNNEIRVVENRSTMQENDLIIIQREVEGVNASNTALEETLA